MNPCPISVAFLFLRFFITFSSSCTTNQAYFTADVSINCGSTRASAARNGRQWLGDQRPKLSPSLQLRGLSAASAAINQLSSADPVPHKTARISRSQFSYAFQLKAGQKIIRLHFNPTPYTGFKRSSDFFTVKAGPFTLLRNFSASLTADALRVNTFAKEFCLNIQENQQLIITFTPESSRSQDTHAFINGIEIISVPATLSYFDGGDIGLRVIGQNYKVYVDDSTALEIVHRLHIKQEIVQSSGDFDGVFPEWATQRANKVRSKSWRVPVEVGFRYLIRLHFKNAGAGGGGAMFKILVNEMIAHTNTEMARGRDQDSIPLYRDYMVPMRGQKLNGRRDILISLQLIDELEDGFEVLAGFEIVKLSNPDDSLASPNPTPPPQDPGYRRIQNLISVLGYQNACATTAIAAISLLSIILHKLRNVREARSTEGEHKPSAKAERHCRRFSLAEIQLATRNFNGGLVIGRGGFGKVYKGLIDNGQTTVAVKRLKSNSQQGAREFLTEVETLSQLRHINLVSLIGYCNEHKEMILVYEYMPCGTLADHLYKYARDNRDYPSLTWKQRLNICIGAARALDYLHTGHGVIHRDVKATNILLDEGFIAKVSDFGLAKHENKGKLQSHVSTKVKGTNGYLDPHYFHTCKLTRKSDAYAFGVVMLETLCGRSAVDLWVAEDEQILSKWARLKISKGEVDQIVACSLKEEISVNSLKAFVEVAERCLHDEPKNRPNMSQVVLQLEFALEQQDSNLNREMNEITSGDEDIDMQNVTLSRIKQIHTKAVTGELTSGRKHGRESTRNNPSRLRPWEAFWNRVKPSKKNELTLSDSTKMKARKGFQFEFWFSKGFGIADEGSREADMTSTSFLDKVNLHECDWDIIAASCNHFSSSNKVGQGGFGSTYKAVLPTGQLVAARRLSESSFMGIKEFYNEILLLPNLQHQNIIKILGYCPCRNDELLVYEFMENTSLDAFIEKEKESPLWLLWSVRFKIITGIAQGLVYLHQDCKPGVIHRDLKLSSILLDNEMNPKISHFGDARSLEGHQSEYEIYVGCCKTPPEIPRHGKLSVKPDVYSFGIIVLEILSGTRASKAQHLKHMTLRHYAQKLWDEGRTIDLIDDSLGAYSVNEALRCIEAALLCTQWDPDQRPEMPCVLKLLERGELPQIACE